VTVVRMERLGYGTREGKSKEFAVDAPKGTERGYNFKLHHEWMIVLYIFV